MLDQIRTIVKSGISEYKNGNLFLNNYIITDNSILKLISEKCIDEIHNIDGNITYSEDLKIGDKINIDFSLFRLNQLGFFESFQTFVLNNKLSFPAEYYIFDLDYLSTNDKIEIPINIKKHKSIIEFINLLVSFSIHIKIESGNTTLLLTKEKTDLLILPIIYCNTNIENIVLNDEDFRSFSNIFINENTEIKSNEDKKNLFINELFEFLKNQEEQNRFVFLLNNFNEFYLKCKNSYQYYIRNFSYNKLKIELDNATIDYSKKIQSVINDAQTKLIAIPVAFVLAFSTLDFSNILVLKNIIALFSLFVFAILIELFLKNQESALNIIGSNIMNFKETFKSDNQLFVTKSFELIYVELSKQKKRLKIIRFINWGIPALLVVLLGIILISK